MDKSVLNLIIGGLYIAAMTFALGVAMSALLIERKRRISLKKNLQKKIESDIELTASDVMNIGKSYKLPPSQSRRILYSVYADIDDKDGFAKLKKLVSDLEKEEPFDDLPEEVKPSMLRLQELSEASPTLSDKSILTPISHSLNKYVELQAEEEKLKKKTNRAWFITLISFVVGLVSFYFTVTAPTANDIATQLKKIQSKQTNDDLSQVD